MTATTGQATTGQTGTGAGRTIISVDAMGGDQGPATVIAGMARSARKNPEIGYILHGPQEVIAPLLAKRRDLTGRVEIRHAPDCVTMDDKPSNAVRLGAATSMWSAIESVRSAEATVCVSCGNTGALMLISVLRLRKLAGVSRPAIAVMWPSQNPQQHNIMLDGGADIRADARDLVQYALMGASYARNGFGLACPRIGLLNVGTEQHKGRAELREAYDLISANASGSDFEFVGFVEGRDLPGTVCDVIVTDGFTGNVALKTGEGTAKLFTDLLREAFGYSMLSKLASVLALTSLRRMKKRIDPRRANGGVFLGLNGTVVKSHGSADETGVSSAIKLAFELGQSNFTDRLAARVASAALPETTEDTRDTHHAETIRDEESH